MGDLISRKDAVSRISDLLMIELQGKRLPTWNEVYNAIKEVPSAEPERKVGDKERVSMVWKPAKGRPVYEKGVCSCGYVLSVLQRDYAYCPMCGSRLEWNE